MSFTSADVESAIKLLVKYSDVKIIKQMVLDPDISSAIIKLIEESVTTALDAGKVDSATSNLACALLENVYTSEAYVLRVLGMHSSFWQGSIPYYNRGAFSRDVLVSITAESHLFMALEAILTKKWIERSDIEAMLPLLNTEAIRLLCIYHKEKIQGSDLVNFPVKEVSNLKTINTWILDLMPNELEEKVTNFLEVINFDHLPVDCTFGSLAQVLETSSPVQLEALAYLLNENQTLSFVGVKNLATSI